MRFVIDLDSLELIESTTDRRRVLQVEGKRGDDSPFEVIFVRGGVAEELAASTVLTFGAKQEGKYDAAAVVLENGFALSGTGSTAKYSANPSFNTAALNALFLIDSDDTNDPTYVDLMAEFTWQVGSGAPTSTKTFRFRVHNDVIRDDETSPTPAYSPIGDTAPVNAAIIVSGAGTTGDNGTYYQFGTVNGKPQYSKTGTASYPRIFWANGFWQIDETGNGVAEYSSNQDVATPDLVTTWNVTGGEGTAPAPTVTAQAATATPPFIRTAGGYLYIKEAGVWKKTALSAL